MTRVASPAFFCCLFSVPTVANLLPVAFFLSVLSPEAAEPNALIYLGCVCAVPLVGELLTLGMGLVRRPKS